MESSDEPLLVFGRVHRKQPIDEWRDGGLRGARNDRLGHGRQLRHLLRGQESRQPARGIGGCHERVIAEETAHRMAFRQHRQDEAGAERRGQALQHLAAKIESALQRRMDLIDNLIKTAQMAGIQEQEVFGKIADARSKLLSAQTATPAGTEGDKSPEQKQEVMNLSNTLGRLLVLTESYPQLRSNENFLKVQDELAGTENRIAVERRKYNEVVQRYNTQIALFPNNLIASMSGYQRNDAYFKVDPGSRAAPKVAF